MVKDKELMVALAAGTLPMGTIPNMVKLAALTPVMVTLVMLKGNAPKFCIK